MLIWQAAEGIFIGLLMAGLVLVPTGVALLGVAMRATPALGPLYGGMSLVLGVAGMSAATVELVGGPPAVAAISVLALIVFHLVMGSKLLRLSAGAARRLSTRADAVTT